MGQFKPMVHNTVPTPPKFRQYRTCDRKKVYGSKADLPGAMKIGWGAVKHIQKNNNDSFPDFELRPYVCEFCGEVHVGHSNTPKSSEARMREEAAKHSAQKE